MVGPRATYVATLGTFAVCSAWLLAWGAERGPCPPWAIQVPLWNHTYFPEEARVPCSGLVLGCCTAYWPWRPTATHACLLLQPVRAVSTRWVIQRLDLLPDLQHTQHTLTHPMLASPDTLTRPSSPFCQLGDLRIFLLFFCFIFPCVCVLQSGDLPSASLGICRMQLRDLPCAGSSPGLRVGWLRGVCRPGGGGGAPVGVPKTPPRVGEGALVEAAQHSSASACGAAAAVSS